MKETVCRDVARQRRGSLASLRGRSGPRAARNVSTVEKIVEIDNPQDFKWINVFSSLIKQIPDIKNKYILKLNLIKSTKSKLYFNVLLLEGFRGFVDNPFYPNVEAGFSARGGPTFGGKHASTNDMQGVSCLIVPTGVGAKYGGYAGDANPIAKLFAAQSKYLLTHPNVVNGAVLFDPPSNMIYLEGFLLDQFLLGKINLIPTKRNKIGVIFDKGINNERLEYEINVLNALRTVYGCEIIGYAVTEGPILVKPLINEFGFSSGQIENLEYIVEKALKLKNAGATAIAICCKILDLELNKDYIHGRGIDPIGGVEAIISRIVSASTGLVSAHAPVLISDEVVSYKQIAPPSASEFIAKTFLPSVISGLRHAPKIISKEDDGLSFHNIEKIILPYNACGIPGVFYLSEYFNKIYLVRENETCLDVNPNHLTIRFNFVKEFLDLIDKESFKECGIDPMVLKRPVDSVQQLQY